MTAMHSTPNPCSLVLNNLAFLPQLHPIKAKSRHHLSHLPPKSWLPPSLVHQHKHLQSYAVQSTEELNLGQTESKRCVFIYVQPSFHHESKHAYANAKHGAPTDHRRILTSKTMTGLGNNKTLAS